MPNINHIDTNAQCPHCRRWFHENYLWWHIKAIHGPESERLHKLFVASGNALHRNRKAKQA